MSNFNISELLAAAKLFQDFFAENSAKSWTNDGLVSGLEAIGKLEMAQIEIEQLKATLANSDFIIGDLRTTNVLQAETISELRSQLDHIRGLIDNQSQIIGDLQTKCETLEASARNRQGEIDILEQTRDELTDQLNTVRSELADAMRLGDSYANEVSVLKERIAEMTIEYNSLEERYDRCHNDLVKANDALSIIRNALAS